MDKASQKTICISWLFTAVVFLIALAAMAVATADPVGGGALVDLSAARPYDSYIIGRGKAAALDPKDFDEALGGHFYTFLTDGNTTAMRKKVEAIVADGAPRRIVFCLGTEEALAAEDGADDAGFYGRCFYDDVTVGSSALTAKVIEGYLTCGGRPYPEMTYAFAAPQRDAERINGLQPYRKQHAAAFGALSPRSLKEVDRVVDDVAAVKELCDENGVELIVVALPLSAVEADRYGSTELKKFWARLAEVTDFWNFNGCGLITNDERYFYDRFHFRPAVGTMIARKLGNAEKGWIPPQFGFYTTADDCDAIAADIFSGMAVAADITTYSRKLSVLMYHYVGDESGEMKVTKTRFEEQLKAMKDAGYEGIGFEELLAYVNDGVDLPEKAVIFTFDDGYLNNYTNVFPLLKEYGFHGTIAVIGDRIAAADPDDPEREYFTFAEAKEMSDSGVISICSHSYGEHVDPLDNGETVRANATVRLPGESEHVYVANFKADYLRSVADIEAHVGKEVLVYAYPQTRANEETEMALMALGNPVSLGGRHRSNTIIKGLPQSLRMLNRLYVEESMTGEAIVKMVEH